MGLWKAFVSQTAASGKNKSLTIAAIVITIAVINPNNIHLRRVVLEIDNDAQSAIPKPSQKLLTKAKSCY